jgi:hypothetical protein
VSRLSLRLDPEPAELDSVEPWRGALERLKARTWPKRGDVAIVLSNHFARYAVVPDDSAASEDEALALARFHFAKIHGERAKGWEVRVSDGLACAIDAALLAELRKIVPKLVSVQPALMAAYNGARKRIPREGAWLVLAEAQRVCVARLGAERWASVHNAREADWEQALERERSRASGETLPSRVLVLS